MAALGERRLGLTLAVMARQLKGSVPESATGANMANSEPSDSRLSTILVLEVTAELGRGSGSSSETGTP